MLLSNAENSQHGNTGQNCTRASRDCDMRTGAHSVVSAKLEMCDHSLACALHNDRLRASHEVLVQPTEQLLIGELQVISRCRLESNLTSFVCIFQTEQIVLVELCVFHSNCRSIGSICHGAPVLALIRIDHPM